MVKQTFSKIREHFDIIYSNPSIEIGLPMKPAAWSSDAIEIIPALYIELGGTECGIREYVIGVNISDFLIKNRGLILCKRYNGDHIIVNTENILTVSEINIVKVKYDSQNPNYEEGIWTDIYLTKRNTKVTLK